MYLFFSLQTRDDTPNTPFTNPLTKCSYEENFPSFAYSYRIGHVFGLVISIRSTNGWSSACFGLNGRKLQVDERPAMPSPAIRTFTHYQFCTGRPDVRSRTTGCGDRMRNRYAESLLICCAELVNMATFECVVIWDTQFYWMRQRKRAFGQFIVHRHYYNSCHWTLLSCRWFTSRH